TKLHFRSAPADAWKKSQGREDPWHQPQDSSRKTEEVRPGIDNESAGSVGREDEESQHCEVVRGLCFPDRTFPAIGYRRSEGPKGRHAAGSGEDSRSTG